jgi:deazaflavin-dependent oxidoreductase (nitroreductase family)
MATGLEAFAEDDYCYLTTKGRVTGAVHTIEIWFALHDTTLYMLSGGGTNADWVKNARRTPEVTVRLRDQQFAGIVRIVENPDEDALARKLLVDKYQPSSDDDLTSWGRTSLPVAVDLLV